MTDIHTDYSGHSIQINCLRKKWKARDHIRHHFYYGIMDDSLTRCHTIKKQSAILPEMDAEDVHVHCLIASTTPSCIT